MLKNMYAVMLPYESEIFQVTIAMENSLRCRMKELVRLLGHPCIVGTVEFIIYRSHSSGIL